jgi:phage terminase large subunit
VSVPAHILAGWRQHPAKFVREVFGVVPDSWQDESLEAFPHHQRLAMKACRGPGKSCVLAWLVLNFLLTRDSPKIAVTSLSAANLEDGLWAELSKWIGRSKMLSELFTWTKSRIFLKTAPDN